MDTTRFRVSLAAGLAVCALWAGVAPARPSDTLCERVAVFAVPEGAPRLSDVCMRSLRRRPRNANDPHDTLEAIRNFHVTRLEWAYGADKRYVEDVHALGCTFQGAAANGSIVVDKSDPDWKNRVGCVDLDGRFVMATWMRTWRAKPIYHCVNNPESRAGALAFFKNLLEVGVDSFQHDATHLNRAATSWGGCFCPHCMKAFNEWLATNTSEEERREAGVEDLATFDYRDRLKATDAPVGDDFGKWGGGGKLKDWFLDFQMDAVTEYHKWWRREIDQWAGRRVSASCNNGTHRFGPPEMVFDYFHGELQERLAYPSHLREAFLQAQAAGKLQVVMMPQRRVFSHFEEWERHTRQTIATAYALGGLCRVPWDQYMPVPEASDKNRYFGTPEQYADLFAFVRGCAGFLDGYSDAAVFGMDLEDERWEGDIPPVTVGDPYVFAFTRAKPGASDAPVAVHLVDWSKTPEPFTVRIDPLRFFAGRPVRATLLTPKPYDRAAHEKAWATKDYAPLVERSLLAEGTVNHIAVPALRPWGLMLVEPSSKPSGDALWAPVVHADPPAFVKSSTARVRTPDEGAVARYTLDGSPVESTSPVYDGPLSITQPGVLRVRAFRGDRASEETAVELTRREPRANLVRNGEFDEGTKGWEVQIFPNPMGDEAMSFTVDSGGRISGENAARLRLKGPDNVPYHMRIYQTLDLKPDANYVVRFKATSDKPARIRANLQERNPPHRVVCIRFCEIEPGAPQEFELGGRNAQADSTQFIERASLHFDCGLAPPDSHIWIDSVVVEERFFGD